MSKEDVEVTIVPASKELADSNSGLINMLFKHEERIRDIESGMGKLNDLTKDTNHHLSNMRISLQLLRPMTDAIEAIEKSCEQNRRDISEQKKENARYKDTVEKKTTLIESDIHHIINRIDNIGPWIKWGVTTIVGLFSVFIVAATTLKILG